MLVTKLAYVDTSALLKRYVPETNSVAFDAWFVECAPALVSSLSLLELRCGLARKRRDLKITAEREIAAMGMVQADINEGALIVHACSDAFFVGAQQLINTICIEISLRSLDALHLTIARSLKATSLATADTVMQQAAVELGFEVEFFGD